MIEEQRTHEFEELRKLRDDRYAAAQRRAQKHRAIERVTTLLRRNRFAFSFNDDLNTFIIEDRPYSLDKACEIFNVDTPWRVKE